MSSITLRSIILMLVACSSQLANASRSEGHDVVYVESQGLLEPIEVQRHVAEPQHPVFVPKPNIVQRDLHSSVPAPFTNNTAISSSANLSSSKNARNATTSSSPTSLKVAGSSESVLHSTTSTRSAVRIPLQTGDSTRSATSSKHSSTPGRNSTSRAPSTRSGSNRISNSTLPSWTPGSVNLSTAVSSSSKTPAASLGAAANPPFSNSTTSRNSTRNKGNGRVGPAAAPLSQNLNGTSPGSSGARAIAFGGTKSTLSSPSLSSTKSKTSKGTSTVRQVGTPALNSPPATTTTVMTNVVVTPVAPSMVSVVLQSIASSKSAASASSVSVALAASAARALETSLGPPSPKAPSPSHSSKPANTPVPLVAPVSVPKAGASAASNPPPASALQPDAVIPPAAASPPTSQALTFLTVATEKPKATVTIAAGNNGNSLVGVFSSAPASSTVSSPPSTSSTASKAPNAAVMAAAIAAAQSTNAQAQLEDACNCACRCPAGMFPISSDGNSNALDVGAMAAPPVEAKASSGKAKSSSSARSNKSERTSLSTFNTRSKVTGASTRVRISSTPSSQPSVSATSKVSTVIKSLSMNTDDVVSTVFAASLTGKNAAPTPPVATSASSSKPHLTVGGSVLPLSSAISEPLVIDGKVMFT